MVINKIEGNVTTSSGSASASLVIQQAKMENIVINPATNTTQYNVSITNSDGYVVYENTDITGDLIENIGIPFYGNATLTISNADADEQFNYFLTLIARYA